ncbi:hypothetical protein SBF1_7350006 [Candidatus Desulfosporosinus infrequens]|uniref:Uncharacterized protein n=1 Tax=Candidatus Desulfosporosinus infrequens TaxID=2043169 RepID=A0A2U3LQJ4_9FIRM|nr:hypothetical protein SBF1_7350006 [Candidatus Desulfosporosinus infrequens]
MFKIIVLWRSILKAIIEISGSKLVWQRLGLDLVYFHIIDQPISKPYFVEVFLYIDTILLIIVLVIFLVKLLIHAASLTEGDISGKSQYEESNSFFGQFFERHKRSSKRFLLLISLQLLSGELLLVIAFSCILATWFLLSFWYKDHCEKSL